MSRVLEVVTEARKAIGAALAVLVALGTAGVVSGSIVTIGAGILGALATGLAVYVTPNAVSSETYSDAIEAALVAMRNGGPAMYAAEREQLAHVIVGKVAKALGRPT